MATCAPGTRGEGEGEARPRRVPGAWVVLVEGRIALYLLPGGHSPLTFPDQLPDPEVQLAAALAALARLPPGGRRHFLLARVDGVAVQAPPPADHPAQAGL